MSGETGNSQSAGKRKGCGAIFVTVPLLYVLSIGPVLGRIRSTVPYPEKAARMARLVYFPVFAAASLSPPVLSFVGWYVSLFTRHRGS